MHDPIEHIQSNCYELRANLPQNIGSLIEPRLSASEIRMCKCGMRASRDTIYRASA